MPPELLAQTPPDVTALPLLGPDVLSLRPFQDSAEMMAATTAALNGLPLSARPDLWQPYAAAEAQVLQAARPVADLKTRFPAQAAAIDAAVARTGHPANALLYLPLAGRKSFWTVLVDPVKADVVAFMPLDSF